MSKKKCDFLKILIIYNVRVSFFCVSRLNAS